MTCRKRRDDVKTGVESLSRDQRGGDPLTARVASGIKVARVRSWLEQGTWEPVASMLREEPKWKPHEGQSTDARHRGGWACSSVEVPVMGMERRGPITQFSSSDQPSNGEESGGETQSVAAFRREVNPAMGRSLGARPGRRPGDKSRMSREAPVRFREGLGVKFPRATRLVICCRADADEAMARMRAMMTKLKLTVNETKTRLCSLPEGSFDFLGYTFGRCFSFRTRRAYLGASPSRKKIAKLFEAIRELTPRNVTGHDEEYVVDKLNQKLVGWANYFSVGTVTKAYGMVNYHVTNRLRRWLCAKHKVPGPGYSRYPDAFLYQKLGLYQLRSKRPSLPNASA
jgi:hypothetical protein